MISQGMPLLFSGSVSLKSGGTLAVDMKEAASRSRLPVLIDEIRFVVQSPPYNDPMTNGFDLGPFWRAEIDLSGRKLTDGYVPIWSFSPQIQTQGFIGGWHGVLGAVVAANKVAYSIYRWRFAKPLFVPSASALITRMQRTAEYDSLLPDVSPTTAATAWVTYSARALPVDFKIPKVIDVPYAANWIAANGKLLSTDTDLVNIFRTPLHIERLIGHISYAEGGGGNECLMDANRWPFQNSIAFAAATVRRKTMTLKLSSGHAITETATPFYRLFDAQTSCLPAKLTLNHLERIHARLFDAPSDTYRPHVSMVGYREERIA